jgi:hypothetical protein
MNLEQNGKNDVIENHCPISIPFKSTSPSIQVTGEKASAKSRILSCVACNWHVVSRRRNDAEERERGKLVQVSLEGGLSS